MTREHFKWLILFSWGYNRLLGEKARDWKLWLPLWVCKWDWEEILSSFLSYKEDDSFHSVWKHQLTSLNRCGLLAGGRAGPCDPMVSSRHGTTLVPCPSSNLALDSHVNSFARGCLRSLAHPAIAVLWRESLPSGWLWCPVLSTVPHTLCIYNVCMAKNSAGSTGAMSLGLP